MTAVSRLETVVVCGVLGCVVGAYALMAALETAEHVSSDALDTTTPGPKS